MRVAGARERPCSAEVGRDADEFRSHDSWPRSCGGISGVHSRQLPANVTGNGDILAAWHFVCCGGTPPILQYVLGFALLGDDGSITPLHYILALAAIIPVGAEHMFATAERPAAERNKIAFLASLATLILVLVVYALGESNA